MKEARIQSIKYRSEVIRTVYIGGGTPSLLTTAQLKELVDCINDCFTLSSDCEFSVECNPGTLTEEWILTAMKAGINRFSIGMQAAQDCLLRTLGRIHSVEDIRHTAEMLQSGGVQNYSFDLMFGLPGQTMEHWKETLQTALSFQPVHLSVYGLIPEEHTPLKDKLDRGVLSLPEVEKEREMYYYAVRTLQQHGIYQYEISNFSKPGFECRHNLGYWKQVPYLGLGLSAASMLQFRHQPYDGMTYKRKVNPSTFVEYADYVSGLPDSVLPDEIIEKDEAAFETIMLRLRLNEGICNEEFRYLHGFSFSEKYARTLSSLEERGLITSDQERYCLTDCGRDLQNTVLVEFMPD